MVLIEIHLGLRQVIMALMNWADLSFGKTLYWLKLSNSGDTLKLLIPSYIRKYISGCSNDACTVISQEILERESNQLMGYRGSKSKSNGNVKKKRIL